MTVPAVFASGYADAAVQRTVTLVENVPLAHDTYRLRFLCPEIARLIVPGQFLMLRLHKCDDPLLGRALALYDTVLDRSAAPVGIDVVYLVVGKLTGKLSESPPGTKLDVVGPLGNGFAAASGEHLIMVAGGIGQTPLMALARESLGLRRYGDAQPRTVTAARRVTFCYGTRTAAYLAGVDDFRSLGVDVRISTDDGSHARGGLVTDLLHDVLAEAGGPRRIVCCGPEPMMEAVSAIAAQSDVPCDASLETPMACGIGICFSCVARVRLADGTWDYKRTCVEGPVFDARTILW